LFSLFFIEPLRRESAKRKKSDYGEKRKSAKGLKRSNRKRKRVKKLSVLVRRTKNDFDGKKRNAKRDVNAWKPLWPERGAKVATTVQPITAREAPMTWPREIAIQTLLMALRSSTSPHL